MNSARQCPFVWILYRARGYDTAQVPGRGRVIIAPNHFSYLDHFFVAAFTRRKVHFMAKSQLFSGPAKFVYRHGGVFPVRRGVADEEAFTTAHAVLAREGVLGMYCEGGRSRTGQVSETAKRGIGRLALESGATIVPVAIYGSQKVRNWKKLQLPKVTVSFGEPMRFPVVADPTREQQQAVADAVLAEIRALYAELETVGRAGVRERARKAAHSATAVA